MNSIRVFRTAMLLTGFLVLLGVIGAQGQANPNPDLVSKLTQQLGITPQQATGGAGAIFGLAKSRLSPADFNKIASVVPGMNGFLKAAPAAEAPAAGAPEAGAPAAGAPAAGAAAAGAPATSASSALGSLGSMAPGGLGGLSSLAGSFQSLKLSPATATQFVPVLQNYISSKGGANVASLFTGALK